MEKEKTEVAVKKAAPLSPAVRFTNMVLSEFGDGVGEVALTKFQQRLVQNYFVAIDIMLADTEQKRKKNAKKKDEPPVTWENVDEKKLAVDVVAAARIGYDPAQPNHINLMAFKVGAWKKYKILFMPGYRGIELKAKKYGLDIPDVVTIELVYSKDEFKVWKKDREHKVEDYKFDIGDPFERGELKGGFYYHEYLEKPTQNKIVFMSVADIEKRKPEYASTQFWGKAGWYEKMCYKTIYRAAFNDMTIDSQKIDHDFMALSQTESEFAIASEEYIEGQIVENANDKRLDVSGLKEIEIPEEEQKKLDF